VVVGGNDMVLVGRCLVVMVTGVLYCFSYLMGELQEGGRIGVSRGCWWE